jgi:Tfp pilus assembly pilus retraction ATPase PilT
MDTSFTLTVSQLFILAIKKKASDIHMHAGTKPVFRIDNELVEASDQAVITKEFMQTKSYVT